MKDKAIYLTEEEQVYLKEIIRKGVHNAHEINRARVLSTAVAKADSRSAFI